MRHAIFMSVLLLVATGCASDPPPRDAVIEFAAVQMISYPDVSATVSKLLDSIFSESIVGRTISSFGTLNPDEFQKESIGGDDVYTVYLPVNEVTQAKLSQDSLAHLPVIMLRVERSTGFIKSVRLMDQCF